MCCFSGRIRYVGKTKIFARHAIGGYQHLVYEMQYRTDLELAMILPLPVPINSPIDALRFIDLSDYDNFFLDLARAFPVPLALGSAGGISRTRRENTTLPVISVGNFEASFIPSLADFGRVAPQFRLPEQVWGELPAYKDYGFAVFQLRKEATKPHPIAFSFPTRAPDRFFYPTLHIHNGAVEANAQFDHVLYCQDSLTDSREIPSWRRSQGRLQDFMAIEKAKGVVDPASHCYCIDIAGYRRNQDYWV